MNASMTISRPTFNPIANLNRRRRLQKAVTRANTAFAAQHPRWAESLFDEHFIKTHVMPQLVATGIMDATTLAAAWADQLKDRGNAARQHRIAKLTPVAAAYLSQLQAAL